MSENNTSRINMKVPAFLTILISLIALVGGGTFTVAKIIFTSKKSTTSMLTTTMSNKKKTLPAPTLDSTSNTKVVSILVGKISKLEAEKEIMVKELTEYSKNALDPKSELYPLLKMLDSSEKEARIQALEGLFKLRDPRSANHLVQYFKDNPDEATRSHSITINSWFNMILGLEWEMGIEFITELFTGKDTYNSNEAFEILIEVIIKTEDDDKLKQKLQFIALNNNNAFTRTRAKLLLSYYEKKKEATFKAPDNRSIKSLLLDIEKEIKNIKK